MQSLIRTVVLAAICCSALSIAEKAQDKTVPSPPEQAILTLHAKGSQIYLCQRVDSSFQWTFIAPAARLFDDAGNEVATHGDGPTWNYQDSSSIQGVVLQKVPSPDAGSVPWLLLKAINPARTGILTKVDFIRRSDTHGGVAPATGCDADHIDADARVPYTATYTFYSAKP
jgi:hypothetical protein